jgi:threonyl-tRNA synthetase
MPKIKITLPDNSIKEYDKGITPLKIAESIGRRLAREAVLSKVNGEYKDLFSQINEDSALQIITIKDKEGLDGIRHSLAHLLAAAVMELWPDAKRTIGPPIENGFYYDFMFSKPITEKDLPKIEKKMRQILPTWDRFERSEATISEAKKEYAGNEFKLELINEFSKEGKNLSFYKSGNYTDLCKGGHVSSMKSINGDAFKLTHIAGAYWRGNEKNPQLTRIYALAFPTKKELDDYMYILEESRKRDHRKIGKQLDLFSFNDLSPGSPFFHAKGAHIFIKLQNFLRELYVDWGYSEVITPLIYDKALWEQSGHWTHFRENMFEVDMDNRAASLKPMNCPSHILIFKTQTRSYRDLPIRLVDFAPLHRNELKGTLGGLMRVRKFSQDDCHVFCMPNQVKQEIKSLIHNVKYIYQDIFGFDFHVELSTKPEKAMGSQELWEAAEKSLKEALEENNVKYKLNPGDGAFYGPKIDFHIKDALGRSWQCGTEQLDFQQPERFKVQYEGEDNKKHNVVMLHRTVLGSLERFIGILIEHFTGKLPLWISPVQVRILAVSEKFVKYAESINKELLRNKLRSEIDSRTESISYKVRGAQAQKIPLIVTVGEKEQTNGTVAVRTIDNKVHYGLRLDDFLNKILKNIEDKKLNVLL